MTVIVLAAALVLLVVTSAWALATESGTRWLLAQASPRLPSALQITDVSGTMLRGVNFRSVRWDDKTVIASVDELGVRIELLPLLRQQIIVQKLDAINVDVFLSDTPPSDTDSAPFSLDLPLTLQIDSASITNIQIAAAGNDFNIEQVQLSGQLSGSSFRIDRFDLHGEIGDISLSGDGQLTGAFPANATAAWELRLPEQAPLSGVLRLRGDTSRYELEHDLDAPYEINTTGSILLIDGEVTADLTNTWQRLHVESGNASSVDLVDGVLNITGTPNAFNFVGDSTVLSGDIPALAVTLSGNGDLKQLEIASVSVTNDWGQLLANGELIFSPQVAWTVDFALDEIDPGVADKRLSGNLQMTGQTTGRIVDEQALANLRLDSVSGDLNGYPVAGSAALSFVEQQLKVQNAIISVGDFRISSDLNTISASGNLNGGRFAVELAGRFAENSWTGVVKKLAIQNPELGEWSLREPANLSASPSQFNLAQTCFGSASYAGLACAMLDYDASGALRFDASVVELPIAALPLGLAAGASVQGTIEIRATGEYADNQLTADTGVKINGLGLNTTVEDHEVAVRFERALASANIVDNRLVGELQLKLEDTVDHIDATVEIGDVFDPDSALAGTGNLEIGDLRLLSFFYPDISNPVGTVLGHVSIGGSMVTPEIVGEVGLTNGSVDIGRTGISVTEIELLLRQREAGRLDLQGGAKSGDGYLKIAGDTSMSSATGIRTQIRLDGEDFSLVRLPDWQVAASPSIEVLFDDRAMRVTGALVIPAANIRVHTVPESTVRPSSDVVIYRKDEVAPAPKRLLEVDVETTLGDEVAFSGFGLSTGLQGSVRIKGKSTSPFVARGRVVLQDGRYQAYGQNLEIETGELIFNGPITSPALNIRATRTASDKTVAGIYLTGTPTNLRSEVYSEPALGDAEALSYLLTGRPLASANSADGDMLNQAAFALGLTTAGNVASRIRNQLGLETLGIQGTSENRQLVAGARLGKRLLVEYAYGVVDNLGTLLLRYQLNNRLIVESRSGSVRIVDVIYSVKKP